MLLTGRACLMIQILHLRILKKDNNNSTTIALTITLAIILQASLYKRCTRRTTMPAILTGPTSRTCIWPRPVRTPPPTTATVCMLTGACTGTCPSPSCWRSRRATVSWCGCCNTGLRLNAVHSLCCYGIRWLRWGKQLVMFSFILHYIRILLLIVLTVYDF